MDPNAAIAIFGEQVATDLIRVSTDPTDLDHMGWWAVTQSFEGEFLAFEFATVQDLATFDVGVRELPTISVNSWQPSMDKLQYENAVAQIRADIARGWVYQANLCYVLSAQINKPFDPIGLWQLIKVHNPAPYLSALYVPMAQSGLTQDIAITSASPELFLKRENGLIKSSPIKGTAKTKNELLEKDRAENVMIVDLIRNDLSQVATFGSVEVPDLLRLEVHPGLVHLVSDVQGSIPADTSWRSILQAMSPPGSVSGAPKSSALEVINRLENTKRGIYCGAFGFVDARNKTGTLAVGIRTFWESSFEGQRSLNFGTGAGITWGSVPEHEWQETQLKASNLLWVASLDQS
jgi:para-aminobenzoate synthetase component 1